MMILTDLVAYALKERLATVITDYDLFILALEIIRNGRYRDVSLKRRPSAWDKRQFANLLGKLHRREIIVPDPDFASHAWIIVGASASSSAEEASSLVDPFCYVSHLSAMQRYALTDRSALYLHITRPNVEAWRGLRIAKIQRDTAIYNDLALAPPLYRIRFKPKIRNRPIKLFETATPGTGDEIKGEATRISTVGRTFLDMLDEPALCGGMRHVLEVWQENAPRWLEDIVAAVDATPIKILKVRAGYILEERLGIRDARVSAWQAAAQRGGSSKLDPESEYRPKFSERWMISINV